MNHSSGTHRPLVSVIMTVFQPDSRFFPLAVRSILKQSLGDFELIIVEDPSSCRGRPLLNDIDDSRIRYFENAVRTSLVDQKNVAIQAANSPLIACLDADDVAESERLAKQVGFLFQHPEIDVVGSQIALIDGNNTIIGYRSFPTAHDPIAKAMERIVPLSQSSVMMRRSVVLQHGGYQFRSFPVAEDYELWSRLAHAGVRFANHPEALIRYRLHPGQLKATHLRDTIRAILHIKKQYWAEHMDWCGRLRMLGERLLLGLPTSLVLRLLIWAQYQDSVFAPPPASANEAGFLESHCRDTALAASST